MRDFDEVLADGGTIHVRSVEPADAPGIVALHSRFSERTRYLRFFGAYPRIPARDLHRFANVDHRDREAFVALVDDRRRRDRTLRAAGPRWRRTPRSRSSSRTPSQRRGIAPVLLRALVPARAGGRDQRSSSPRCCRATSRCSMSSPTPGSRSTSQFADGVVHVRFPITSRTDEVSGADTR